MPHCHSATRFLDKMPEKCHPGGFEKSCGVEGRFSSSKKIVTTDSGERCPVVLNMEMIRSGTPPVFSRDKSDGVPGNLKNIVRWVPCACLLSGPLRENGRAPIGSLDYLYQRASSECITNRKDVLWKALWMHTLTRFRLHLEGRHSGLIIHERLPLRCVEWRLLS